MALTWQSLENSVTISFSKELVASTQYLGNVVLFSSRLMGGKKPAFLLMEASQSDYSLPDCESAFQLCVLNMRQTVGVQSHTLKIFYNWPTYGLQT